MASIAFERVSKVFPDGTRAVDGLDLEIEDGEFTILVGPSGSGKSTALRMVAGLEDATDGSITIGERRVNDVAPRDRDIAMVFQSYALYPHMSVDGNMGFALKMQKQDKASIASRVAKAGSRLGIGELMARRPKALSGGQRQRVALGRAIVRSPQAFLMDEPLSNLDAKLRTQTRGEIRRLQQEVGVTTVYVTHDQVEAMTMGDRIAVMNHGVLEQVGTPEEVYEQPANRFVAGFIGSPSMAFIEHPDQHGLRADVVVGVRPEHARPWRDGLIGPLRGTVAFVEALGRETFVGVDIGDARLVVFEEGRATRDVGEELEFGLVESGLRYFDSETGAAI